MREALSEFLTRDKRNGYTFYIKSATEDFLIRRPKKEYQAYGELSPFFKMPRVKLLESESGSFLVVKGIDDLSVDQLVVTDPVRASKALSSFVDGLGKMWQRTAVPMNEATVSRNWRGETLNTLVNLLQEPRIKEIVDKNVMVNGKKYPSAGETLGTCVAKLSEKPDPVMVWSHGDEHIANILPNGKDCYVIDPGNWTGYNTPAAAVNNLIAGNYVFTYRYKGNVSKDNGVFRVDYELEEEFKKSEELMKPTLRKVFNNANGISGEETQAREFLFANIVRCGVGWINRSDIDYYKKFGMAYLGMATEMYYKEGLV